MALICKVCSQLFGDFDDKKMPAWLLKSGFELFESPAQLRLHLIEEHSKFVAESLLAPNIHNKMHIWLLENIDYSANGIDGAQHENVEDTEQKNEQQQQEEDEEEEEEAQNQQQQSEIDEMSAENNSEEKGKSDGDGSGEEDPIEVLLKDIFGGYGGAAVAETEEEPTTSGEMQHYAKIEQIEQNNEKLVDPFGTALKSLLFSVSADSPLSDGSSSPNAPPPMCRASMVDSKAIRKAHCQVCNLDICSTARQRHVYMVHLKKKDLFKCPHCEYTNSNSVWEVQKHSRVQHGKDARPISQEEKHKLEIQLWSQLCFPEWKQKRKIEHGDSAEEEAATKRRREGEGGTEVDDLLEGFGELLGHILQQQNEAKNNAQAADGEGQNGGGEEEEQQTIGTTEEQTEDEERRPSQEDEWRDNTSPSDKPSTITGDECAAGNDRLCHLCMEESKYPGRHIAQRHLKRPLYECPICGKFGSYESCTVSKHINKVHPKEAKSAVPISNLEKYADEIRELQIRCFPNRQMKLVRPATNPAKARPRERHQCGLCSADVAQSDRQRHVFHKHLRKGKIFECPLCDFSSNYDIHRVKWHIKWDHKDFVDASGGVHLEPISHESLYRDEIDALNDKCFPGWQRKRYMNVGDSAERTSESPSTMRQSDENRSEEGITTTNWTEEGTTDGGQRAETEGRGASRSTLDDLIMEMVARNQLHSWGADSPIAVDDKARSLLAELDGAANALEWTCQLCHVALKPGTNLLRHVAKDHLNLPLYQCPICENHGAHSAYEVRSHMLRTHADTTQEPLSSLEANLGEIEIIYRRCFPRKEFKAGGSDRCSSQETLVVTRQTNIDEARVRCRECGQEMKTEDRQIHVYRHHLREPRLYECPVCDFSHYACSSDVRNHILRAHKNQPTLMPRANLLRFSREIAEWNERCFPGWINRRLPASVTEDFNSCRLCGVDVRQTSRHIAEYHLNIPLHQCPLCEYGAAEARLVQRHMRNNHTLKECEGLEPIANVEKHRGEFSELHNQCFPGRPKRLSNITIADESRRAKCRGCGQTISKKRRLLHLLEKHLKKPIYKCKYCLFTSTHDKATVDTHQREKHSGKAPHVLTTLTRHKMELKRLATECFNEPDLKLDE